MRVLSYFGCALTACCVVLCFGCLVTAGHDGDVRPGGDEEHRRGDEQQLEASLQAHVRDAWDKDETARIATRRKIHEAHIRAHLAADPDVVVEASEETRKRFIASRRKLLLESSATSFSGLRGAFLVGVVTLPLVAFVVWMKS